MKFNTIPFTNTDDEDFTGMSGGVEFTIQAGETRYFPSNLSRRFVKVLSERILRKQLNETPRMDKRKFLEEVSQSILGKEMMTKTPEPVKTFKQEVLDHEAEVKATLADKERQAKEREIEALNIVKHAGKIHRKVQKKV